MAPMPSFRTWKVCGNAWGIQSVRAHFLSAPRFQHGFAGKQVTKSSTKFKQLGTNETLSVGGFELEVVAEIPPAEYASGRIFVGASPVDAPANNYVTAITSTRMPAKKFKAVKEPLGGGHTCGVKVWGAEPWFFLAFLFPPEAFCYSTDAAAP
jgi:hypothetical protein